MSVMRKLLMMIMIIALVIPAGQAFSAAATETTVQVSFVPMHYVIDGIDYAPPQDQLGFIYNDSTYVPLRFVGTILNKTIGWDGVNSKVTVAAPKSEDWKSISSDLSAFEVKDSVILPVDGKTISKTAIKINFRDVIYEFNGQLVEPNAKTPGFIYGGRIFVPLRFMYETLGFDPGFDQSTYTISTTTDAEQLEYQTIVKTNDKLIVDLKAKCEGEFVTMGFQFLANQSKMTQEEKDAFFVNAEAKLVSCKADIQILLDNLTDELTAANQPTDVVAEYLAAIEKQIADARVKVEAFR